ncbi:PEP-CTERM sorting domain-containing protein [Novipirellula artificiosorum]|uniref:Ice-binding protein C-terminal domain-containing protein n=1 Tax=Novipirellula artificiosorum TaxID=2528016 RepID=A0A5C6E2V3_9BACT|nr:PEP-CTERM sorting domain-containing protein [Novipirellula artificiosorum]TWU41716.1 hypothetical protein Poly41_00080 [Novipirellula artificiosorum]
MRSKPCWNRSHRRTFAVVVVAWVMAGSSPGDALADWKDDIGYTALQAELGAATPTGVGVNVSQGEARVTDNGPPTTIRYMPNTASAQLSTKTFTDGSGMNVGVNSHADGVANLFIGNTASIAPGVINITNYDANDWLDDKLGSVSKTEPVAHPFKVQNHSWIANAKTPTDKTGVEDLAKRVDYLVNRDDVLIIGGSTNSGSIPDLLAHSYNAISVGRTDGGHGSGPTTFYGSGRPRPDIVAPSGTTSGATPMVSSTAAMLYETAAGSNADHVETMRAVLMAGATKNEFASWDRTATRPIDEVYGAGEVNAYNSYQILAGGETNGTLVAPLTAAGLFGYDFVEAIDFSGTMQYRFDVDPGFVMDELSIFLSWNIQVTNASAVSGEFIPDADPSSSASLSNLELTLRDASNAIIDQSISGVDNFEHIYLQDLAAGSYTLQVSRDQAVDYGLAWRSSISAVPEPASVLLLSSGFAAWGFRRKAVAIQVTG